MENTSEQSAPATPAPPSQQSVPYSTSVLVLGIISIVGCWCYGMPGVVCGIISIVQSNKGKLAYQQNPSLYTPSSLKNLNAGRICGIIGLCLSGILLVTLLIEVLFFGFALSHLPWNSFMK